MSVVFPERMALFPVVRSISELTTISAAFCSGSGEFQNYAINRTSIPFLRLLFRFCDGFVTK